MSFADCCHAMLGLQQPLSYAGNHMQPGCRWQADLALAKIYELLRSCNPAAVVQACLQSTTCFVTAMRYLASLWAEAAWVRSSMIMYLTAAFKGTKHK